MRAAGRSVVLALLVGAGALCLGSAVRERAEPRFYEAWVRPGEYNAFVLCTNNNVGTRRWIVHLVTPHGSFPVSITPGETVVVPFEKGWSIKASDEVHFRSRHVQFNDMTEWEPLAGDDQAMVIGVWGITPSGPVGLVPPKE